MKTAIQVCSIIFVGLFLTFGCTPTPTTETPILSLSTVSTTAASGVTSSGATLGGNVTTDGNATVTERGVVYATTQTPTISNTKVAAGTGIGSFTANVTGLTSGTTYYVRAYAVNSQGTAYGSPETFTCSLILSLPTVTTTAPSTITSTGATLGGNVTTDGNATVTERGVVYATTQTPTTSNTKVTIGTGTGSFTTNVTGLTSGITYYVRAYAINSQGTAYGSQETFICSLTLSQPSVTTTAAAGITSTGVTLGGNVTADGNATVSERGVVYATTQTPTTSNTKVTIGTGTGSFTTNVTGLTSGITYYVRAYAINSQGTAYGSQATFTTSLTLSLPTVTTAAATSITSTGVTLGGNVTADGNAAVTERGVVYATTQTPTTSNTKVAVGTGTGSFTTNVTGLTAGTIYYVRAYAINSLGTAYGNEISFTTAAPTLALWAFDIEISTGTNSSGIAITPDNSKIIVTNNTIPGTIKVISTSNYAITTISYPADAYPNGVAVSPDGLTAIVNTMHQTIYIDLSTNSIIGNFAAPCVATTLYGLALNTAYAVYPDLSSGCTQQGLRILKASPPNTSSAFIQIPTSGQLYGIALTGSSAIVTAWNAAPINVNISTSGVQKISGMTSSYGVAVLHNGNEALIEGDSLNRVSLTSNKVINHISDIYSTTIQSIAITADDKYAFVVGAFKTIVISLADNTIIQTFSTGGTSVTTTSDGSKFFITNSYNGTVSVYKKK